MENTVLPARLPDALLPWYRENRRDLPWRADREPYHVWISEIMLQQTRVEAVRGYYSRFLAEFPDTRALAFCDDEKLQKLWEGLGYYSRMRNLKRAAGIIEQEYGGSFPNRYEDILALPGIGEYTAGAICSIAYGQPTPAVDGNVLRVCSRLLNDETPVDLPETRQKYRKALAVIYPEDAGAFTQSLMELGATLCGPNREPRCRECPCEGFCLACQKGTAGQLPRKTPKRAKREEDRTVFIFSCEGHYALRKRPDTGLLAGLWEFPNVPGKQEPASAMEIAEALGVHPRELLRQTERKHIFTHIQWNLRGYYIETAAMPDSLRWFTGQELTEQTALPTAFRQFWEETDYV